MIPENLAVVGALIASIGGLYYFYQTLVGKTQPNRVTWLLWGVFPMITFFAQRAQGVEGLSWATLTSGLTPFLVLGASFLSRKAFWKSQPLDYACMAVGVLGIVLWAITDNPNLAIAFAILADTAAAVPTLIKCRRHPASESWLAYGMSTVGYGFTMLTIQTWSFQNFAFITYLTLINLSMAVLSFNHPKYTQKYIDK